MAFIRVKKAKRMDGSVVEYAYIVENRRVRSKQIKQKSKKYLGRVYRFDRANMMDFYEHFEINDVGKYLNEGEKNDIILDLIRLELFNHGFEEEKGVWINDEVNFDEKSMKLQNSKGKSIAVAMNDGYLTSYALRKILRFRAFDEEEGYDFAKMFIESGIAVPKDVFTGIFMKILE